MRLQKPGLNASAHLWTQYDIASILNGIKFM